MWLIDISRSLTSRSQWSSPSAIKRPKYLFFRRKIDKIPLLIEKKVNLQNNLWWKQWNDINR